MSSKNKRAIVIIEKKTTQLHTASANGEPQRLKLLIESGANVNVEDKDGAMPLHHASYNGHLKCVRILLASGAKINAKDSEGNTALHNAALGGHFPVVEFLVSKGASIDEVDNENGTPFLNACSNGHIKVIDFLIKKGAKVNAVDCHGTTALHYASYYGHEEVLKLLLTSGCKVEMIDNDGGTPLHHAAANGNLKCMRLLLKNKANINVTDHTGTTPLHAAAYNGKLDCVKEILEFARNHVTGIDLRPVILACKDHEGSTPLHKVAFQGEVDILQLLLDNGADKDAPDKEHATALHKAAFKGNTACVRLLIERGARLDICDNQGGTALYNACYNGYVRVVELLLSGKKEDVEKMINLTENQGRGPLHASACYGHWECTNLLIKSGAALNLKDKDDMTPLHLAAYNGSQLSMSFLLHAGAECNIPNKDGVYPLHYAAYNGWLATVHALVEKQAPINVADNKGATAIHYAAACNRWEVLAYLIFKGAEIDSPNKEGQTPLFYATKNNAIDSVVTLIERNADPDYKDRRGNTPRKIAKGGRNNITKRIYDTVAKKPYSAEALARLSDFKDKKLKAKDMASKHLGGTVALDSVASDKLNISSPFADLGFTFDLNDPGECMDYIFKEAKQIEFHWTVLNLCRLMLLIPPDPSHGAKMWNLLETFAHQLVTSEPPTATTKLTFQEFLPMWKNRAQVKIKKTDILNAIENAFPIMFPNRPKRDEHSDVTFRLEDDTGEKAAEEPAEDGETAPAPAAAAAAPKEKKKFSLPNNGEEEEEGGDEEEETPTPKIFGKKAFTPAASDAPEEEALDKNMNFGVSVGPPPSFGGGGPPPPPPPPGGGPPPPPPPPGGKGGPPPPPGLGGGPKIAPPPKPKMKLRKLDWKKIPKGQLPPTIWKFLKSEGVEIDEPSLIEYFKIEDEENKPKVVSNASQKIEVLDGKKANHIGLMLSMMKLPNEEIRRAILEADDSKFSEEGLKAFIKLAPKKEEIEQLKQYVNAPPDIMKKLQPPEKFILSVMDIPRLEGKLHSFLFKRIFESQFGRLKEDIEVGTLAIKEVKDNVNFARVLELILNVGNWLNYGTYAGGCLGFTLESLSKLRDTKSPKQLDITLLHYMVMFMGEKRPRLLTFPDELQHISKGSAEQLVCIQGEFAELQTGFTALKEELAALQKEGQTDSPFAAKMVSFHDKADTAMQNLGKELNNLLEWNKQLYTYFAADPSSDVIMIVHGFCTQFNTAITENKQREEARAKANQKKKRKKIKRKKASTSSKTKALMNTPQLREDGQEIIQEKEEEPEDNDDALNKYFPEQDHSGEDSDSEKLTKKKVKVKKKKAVVAAEPTEEASSPSPAGDVDETSPKDEDREVGGETEGMKKVKKVKKVKKIKKIKKAARSEDDDEDDKDVAKEEE